MAALLDVVSLVCIGAIGVTLAVGLWTGNTPAAVNGVATLAVASLPHLVTVGTDVAITPVVPAWLAIAGLLHMAGMLGWYDTVWWWDHLTHTLSAAFLAALVYASLHTMGESDWLVVAGVTVLFTLAAGVFWELTELAAREIGDLLDRPPVLEHYGLRDTALDVCFNALGAGVVVALDVRVFVGITDRAPRLVETLVVGSAVVLFVGTIGLGLVVGALTKLDAAP